MWQPVFPIVLMPDPQLELMARGMAGCGVELVEIGAWGGQFNYSDPEACARAAETLRSVGLQPYSFHLSFGRGYDFAALDEGEAGRAIDRLCRQLEAVAATGARYAVVHPAWRTNPADRALHLRNARRGLRRLARAAEKLGVVLAIENMPPGYLACDIAELCLLIDACESSHAAACYDTGHAHVAGIDQAEALQMLGARLATIHLHDNDGTADQHLASGLGTIDWAKFYDALKSMGWFRPICVELMPRQGWTYCEFAAAARAALASATTMVAARAAAAG